MNKKEQRDYIRGIMQGLEEVYCLDSDRKIFEKITHMEAYRRASCIFCYVSVGTEPDTLALLQDAWSQNKRTVVPRCIGKGIMELCEIKSLDDLESGHYNIPEPKKECPVIQASEIDFGIIPCLSCDRQRNRLGHGGGYYDRYLAGTDFLSVALCREKLLLDEVCMEEYDLPVDVVVTEDHIYS